MFSREELIGIFGFEPVSESKHGFQFLNTLDIFFVKRDDNKQILELANEHITTVGSIRVQDSEFVKTINEIWHDPEGKPRKLMETVDPELQAELLRSL